MAAQTLTTLPTEILVRICSLLYESHILSLEAFSLGNKRCFTIAATVLAHTITFRINTPTQLSEDVDKCKQLLGRHQPGLFQHVRRLVIFGRMDSPYCATGYGGANPNWEDQRYHDDSEDEYDEGELHPDDEDEPIARKEKRKQITFHFSLPTTDDWDVMHTQLHDFHFESAHGRGAIPLRQRQNNGYDGDPDEAPASAAYDTDHHWLPLADLIPRLPGLVDVVYRCPSQFPPCLLKAMHASEKPARLHLQMFKLRSAYDDSPTIDPYELEIITSSCLYSIWPQYRIDVAENGEQAPSRQLDAVMWMLQQASASLHLREANVAGSYLAEKGTMRSLPGGLISGFSNDFRGPVGPWNRATFFHQEQKEAVRASALGKGHLTHLRFDSGVCSTPHESIFGCGDCSWIEKWDNLTDFSMLRTLALVQPLSQVQVLLLRATCLPGLTALSLTCELPSSTEGETTTTRSQPDYFQTIAAFLSGLPSLTVLQVTAWDHARHTFSFHNSRLEKLSLVPVEGRPYRFACDLQNFLTLEGLAALVSSFPCLTDLSIPVKRSRGSSAEVALYRYIGEHMPSLRRLSLRLDCSPPRSIVTDQSDHDTPFLEPYPSDPRWPAVGAALNRDKDEYAHSDCRVNRYRNGHIYDIFINAALDASLARKIFTAVGGNLETLLVQTYGGLNFSQLGPPPRFGMPRGVKPAGDLFIPFLYGIGKQWMVEQMNNKLAVKEMDHKIHPKSMYGSSRVRSKHSKYAALLRCFRRVWPDEKEGSKGWHEDWESWGLETE
ncbi:uncharacterized protein B0H64DRAFT_400270 [Chaetomium fimeti]|uniref:Uncharacterized protein n=1 Tax=Chaetomium fimeti TaxID=1854472 RepID=A0AAE0LQM9_9PEZI|nr:hypothetical protein B0H64DRAFT_400270 [Chaetomium fimeti]